MKNFYFTFWLVAFHSSILPHHFHFHGPGRCQVRIPIMSKDVCSEPWKVIGWALDQPRQHQFLRGSKKTGWIFFESGTTSTIEIINFIIIGYLPTFQGYTEVCILNNSIQNMKKIMWEPSLLASFYGEKSETTLVNNRRHYCRFDRSYTAAKNWWRVQCRKMFEKLWVENSRI